MTESRRTYQVHVDDANSEESGQVLAALKDLEAEANQSISGSVSVEIEQDSLDSDGFVPAGETD